MKKYKVLVMNFIKYKYEIFINLCNFFVFFNIYFKKSVCLKNLKMVVLGWLMLKNLLCYLNWFGWRLY